MSNFLWVKTEKRAKMLEDLEDIPEIGKKSKSELIEMALEEFLKKHQQSNNPQMKMDLFNKNIRAVSIPHLYENDAKIWEKFYNHITKKDFKELDKNLNWLNDYHNKMEKVRKFV